MTSSTSNIEKFRKDWTRSDSKRGKAAKDRTIALKQARDRKRAMREGAWK